MVEGAPLLREYGALNSIEGSNPSLSATLPWQVVDIALSYVNYLPRESGENNRARTLDID